MLTEQNIVEEIRARLAGDPRIHNPTRSGLRARGRGDPARHRQEPAPAPDDVGVASRWLTLSGAVKRQSESDAAFEVVSRIAGVGGITNRIEVVTAGLDG
ncbi:MAG TPA: BON domain-containing protein [Solirubrobacteraceae bacterium]